MENFKMPKGLDGLIQELDYLISEESGFNKYASTGKMDGGIIDSQHGEENVLGGGRTDTKGSGIPHSTYAGKGDKEMGRESFEQGRPLEESYDESVTDDYALENERQKEVRQVGEKKYDNKKEVNKMTSKSEKAAYLAERILRHYQKKASEEKQRRYPQGRDLMTGEPSVYNDPRVYSQDAYQISKQAGIDTFNELIASQGGQFLHKTASLVDPYYQEYKARQQQGHIKSAQAQEFQKGAALADAAIGAVEFEKGASLADVAIDAVEFEKGASLADAAIGAVEAQKKKAFNIGSSVAEQTINKLAADLIEVRPIIQDLVSKDLLTQDERDALVSALSSADHLTPEIIDQAAQGLTNADVVAEALIKAIEGPQGANIVPEPAQSVHSPTMPPSYAPVDEEVPGEAVPKEDASPEDELIIQAALRVLDKKAEEEVSDKYYKDFMRYYKQHEGQGMSYEDYKNYKEMQDEKPMPRENFMKAKKQYHQKMDKGSKGDHGYKSNKKKKNDMSYGYKYGKKPMKDQY